MTTLDYGTVVDAAYVAGLDEDCVRTNYSGRAMYGKDCFGLVHGSIGELLLLIVALADRGVEMEFVNSARSDNMGLDMITYFPGTTLAGVPA
jgi:hypothetical protein